MIQTSDPLWLGLGIIETYWYYLKEELYTDKFCTCLKYLPEGRKVLRILGQSINTVNSTPELTPMLLLYLTGSSP